MKRNRLVRSAQGSLVTLLSVYGGCATPQYASGKAGRKMPGHDARPFVPAVGWQWDLEPQRLNWSLMATGSAVVPPSVLMDYTKISC